MKKIVKRIARWVLREELEELKSKHQSDLETFSKESEYLNHENEELQRINEDLRKRLFGSRKVLLSQTMVECIVKMLPDPNKAGTGGLTSSDLKMRNMGFVDRLRGHEYQHSVRFVEAKGDDKGLQGLTINISEYNINIFIPLRRENVSYELFGVQTAIDTYFWDLYGAGIRMLSNEAFEMSSEFVNAQRNVLKEFREEGLL